MTLSDVEELENLWFYLYRMINLTNRNVAYYEGLKCFDGCRKVVIYDRIVCTSCINQWYIREATESTHKWGRFCVFFRRSAGLNCKIEVKLKIGKIYSTGQKYGLTFFRFLKLL